MKNILILLICLVGTFSVFAQQKITRYCVLNIHQRTAFSTARLTVELQPWRHPEVFSFRDSTVLPLLWKVTTMETIPDVLNYMSDNGWTFISATTTNYLIGIYYFKREFDPAELAPPPAK